MRMSQRIFWNTVALVLADLLRLLIGIVLTLTVARALGAAELGRLTLTLSVVTILASLGELGLSTFYIKESQLGNHAILTGAFIGTRLLSGSVVAAGLAAYAFLKASPALSPLLLMGSILLWLGIWPSIAVAALRARELMVYEAAAKILAAAATTLGGVAVILAGYGVTGVLATMVVIALGMAVWYGVLAVRFLPRPIQLRQPISAFASLLRGAWPFASLSILVMIYFRIDSVMLFALKGEEALGQYSAAYRILEAGLMVPWAISASALPAATRTLQSRREDVLRASLRLIQFMLALGIPIAAAGLIFSDRLVLLLYGPQFAQAGNIFRILLFALVAVYAASVTSTLISASAHPSVNTGIALIMTVLNVGLNAVLIPRWTGMGAAAATAVTEATGLLLGTLYIRKSILPLGYAKYCLKPAVAALIALLVAYPFPPSAALPIFIICYTAGLWGVGGMTREDLASLRMILLRPSAAQADHAE